MRSLAYRVISKLRLSEVIGNVVPGRLQILCYHGFSFLDEHLFRGKLFMTAALFEKRLEWLKKNHYRALPLSEALYRLQAGKIGRKEFVLTIDDGFHSVIALAAPLLRAYDTPATVYVTTYYVIHQHPIFRLAIQYMAWKSERQHVDLAGLLSGLNGETPLHGTEASRRLEALYMVAEGQCTEAQRVQIARHFGERVNVDYDELVRSRRLTLMNQTELASLRDYGLDIQLHTHRHRLPLRQSEVAIELAENRGVLSAVTKADLQHLCYPSGIWSPSQWSALKALGVTSATTCVPGLNTSRTPPLALHRFLDGQDITMDEFKVEMSGIKDIARRSRRLLRHDPSDDAPKA